jgi:hypothetical protein
LKLGIPFFNKSLHFGEIMLSPMKDFTGTKIPDIRMSKRSF